MFDKITEISLLYDFYGQLLTPRQNEAMRLYHEENYSLSEIASEFEISRQAVHDALKTAEKSLTEYEKRLGLVKRFSESREAVAEIEGGGLWHLKVYLKNCRERLRSSEVKAF